MELLSREQREGEPLACAYGCRVQPDGTIRAGFLFARAEAPPALTLFDPATGRQYAARLPDDYTGQDDDVWGTYETLEAP